MTISVQELQQLIEFLLQLLLPSLGLPRPCPLTVASFEEDTSMATHTFKYTINLPAVSGPTITKRTVNTVTNGGAPVAADYDITLATFDAVFNPLDVFGMTLVESDAAGNVSPSSVSLDVTVPAASGDTTTLPQPSPLTVASVEEVVQP